MHMTRSQPIRRFSEPDHASATRHDDAHDAGPAGGCCRAEAHGAGERVRGATLS